MLEIDAGGRSTLKPRERGMKMRPRIPAPPIWMVPAFLSLMYVLAGLALIPHPGLQNDELFFSGPLFSPDTAFYSVTLGSMKLPVMVMSYTGALKTWLYAGLFHIFHPNVSAVRVPVLLMGAATIWLTWAWVRRIAGTRAAVIATALLASDTLFLLTDIFDWGPVAIQHLTLMGGLVAVSRWVANGSRRWLAVGFFVWGLGMWDKALLIWPLAGLSIACLLTWPGAVFPRVRLPAIATALVAFVIGMSPLLVYNLERHGETATANAKLTTADLPNKVEVLRQTINGSSLFDYMVKSDSFSGRRAPRTRTERASVWISGHLGTHRSNWMVYAWIAGLLCFLALWRTRQWRLLLFLLITVTVTWIQMALTKGAGGGAHHVILLWPFAPVFLGIAFAGIADLLPRPGWAAVAVAVAILTLGNLLTTNQYLSDFTLSGGTGGWTDAIYPLSASLEEKAPGWIGLVDWGYFNSLAMLHKGRLRLFLVNPDGDAAEIKTDIGTPAFLFIQHTAGREIFPGVNARFRKAAERQGYFEHTERIVNDSSGRPVFELFRFQTTP